MGPALQELRCRAEDEGSQVEEGPAPHRHVGADEEEQESALGRDRHRGLVRGETAGIAIEEKLVDKDKLGNAAWNWLSSVAFTGVGLLALGLLQRSRDRRWEAAREEAFALQGRIGYMRAQDKDRFMRQLGYFQSRYCDSPRRR